MGVIQIAQDVVRVSIRGQITGSSQVSSVLYYHAATAPSGDDDADLASFVMENWQQYILDMLHGQYVVSGAAWIEMTAANSPSGEVPVNVAFPTAGQLAGEVLPPNCAMLVHKQTAILSRKSRPGRWFLPGIIETQVTGDGVITSTALSNAQSTVNAFFAAASTFTGAGALQWTMVQPHFFLSDKPPEPPPGTDAIWVAASRSDVTGLRVDTRIGTQRRRLR